jgi:hypothetical protein
VWREGAVHFTGADGSAVSHEVTLPESIVISGPWKAAFTPGLGAPEEALRLDSLMDWKDHPDFGVRHFSGIATYETAFDLEKKWIEECDRLALDLGEVAVIAEVTLNGKPLGVLWKPPFRVDVWGAVRAGQNRLQIKVANQWQNRLIGDEKLPSDIKWSKEWKGALEAFPDWVLSGSPRPEPRRKTFTTWRHITEDDPLLPSGLLGPVRLMPVRLVATESD